MNSLVARLFPAAILLVAAVFPLVGCMPDTSEAKVAKHRSSKEVVGRWTSVRGSRGQSSKTTYTFDGKQFEGLWEITNPIGGHAKLQLKLPPEWSHGETYNAVAHVFETEPDQPWYYPIEDVFLADLRSALLSDEEKSIIPGATPDMPYETSTKVIKRGNETFIELVAKPIPGVE